MSELEDINQNIDGILEDSLSNYAFNVCIASGNNRDEVIESDEFHIDHNDETILVVVNVQDVVCDYIADNFQVKVTHDGNELAIIKPNFDSEKMLLVDISDVISETVKKQFELLKLTEYEIFSVEDLKAKLDRLKVYENAFNTLMGK